MKVTLYSKSDCQGCRLTEMKFQQYGIVYRKVRVDQDEQALDHVFDLGYSSVPVVEVDFGDGAELHWCGYKPDHVRKLSEV